MAFLLCAAAASLGSGTVRSRRRHARRLGLACVALLASVAVPAVAAPTNARISDLSDVAFNTISDLTSDSTLAEDVCVYSSTNLYRVTGTGSGPGGAFTLAPASGSTTLAYEVEWKAQAGQTSGTQLSAGVPLTGLTSVATQQQCNSGPSASASLIVVLRSAALSSATAGSYSGSLTLLIAPE